MKKTSIHTYSASRKCRDAIIVAFLISVSQINPSLGAALQSDPPAVLPVGPGNNPTLMESGNNTHESGQKFKNYFKEKYQNIDMDITSSDVKRTKYGLSGSLWISGDIVPHKKPAIDVTKEPDRHVRARAIAKAFMEDEAALFDITNPDELRELNISTDKMPRGDYTFINYQRYINGIQLKNADMQIVIGPTEDITTVQARLVAVPPEVYEATKKETLSEEEIRSIIESDIKQNNIDTKDITTTYHQIAILDPPYVIWKANSYYNYIINAFTGQIITKHPARKYSSSL